MGKIYIILGCIGVFSGVYDLYIGKPYEQVGIALVHAMICFVLSNLEEIKRRQK